MALNAELKTCAPLTTTNTYPVLQMVRLTATIDAVTLDASNLDTAYRAAIPATVKEPGEVCLSAARLRKLAGEMEGEFVTVETDEKHVAKLTAGACVVRLYGLPGDDFPAVTLAGKDAATVPLDGAVFKLGDFASTDETRHILNGVFVSVSGGELTAVATDGRRLALREFAVEGAGDCAAIIPSPAARMFAGMGAGILRVGSKAAEFATAGRIVMTRLIDGAYPNYRQVIPAKGLKATVLSGLGDLAAAIHRVSLVSGDSVHLTVTKGKLAVLGTAADVGSGAESVECRVRGADFDVAVAPSYLLAALAHLPADGVLEVTDAIAPIVARGGDFTGVIMPMRVK
jgi:DNA polymerase-3 subunit beta